MLVPPARWGRWVENFVASHGEITCVVADGGLRARAADGSTFVVRLPFDVAYPGPADPGAVVGAVVVPDAWGLLLVRRGGFAVARMAGVAIAESKVGQRHVQGRTKAGGQSQQRFARRRDNQARQAFEAAGEHAVRILGGHGQLPVVVGGDRPAVDAVLGDPRLRTLRPVDRWLPVPDPRRAVLEQAVVDATAVAVDVVNA